MVKSDSLRQRSRKSLEDFSIKTIKSGDRSITIKSQLSYKSITSPNQKMRVIPVRALQDNYMYLLIDESTRQAAAVDPVNASAMASAVGDHNVDLKAILTTHHHYDHAHGNNDMLAMFPDIHVYGGDTRVQALNKQVQHGDTIRLGTLLIECLSTPCHTRGHICYYVTSTDTSSSSSAESGTTTGSSNGSSQAADTSSNSGQSNGGSPERVVFTGDTLFIGGCGRFFEGSAEQMDQNLNVTLGSLPNDTRVYCGHEYTVTNLKFALSVEPQNTDIKSKLAWAQSKVSKRDPTVPSTIGEEKKINPFMRLDKSQVKKFTGESDRLEVMSTLRQRKNDFQP